MAPTTYLCIGFFLLLGRHGSMAELKPERNGGLSFGQVAAASSSSSSSSSGCEFAFDRLQPVDPLPKMRAEAGTLEYFNDANQQLRCAGVFMVHVDVDNRGLLLPRYTNNGRGALYLVVEGRGYFEMALPGCPETPIRRRSTKGDVIALPPGVPVWIYNDGSSNTPLEFLVAFTVGGQQANQLETEHRDFVLAGSNGNRSRSIFRGFNRESLSRSFGISQDLVGKLLDQQMDPVFLEQRGTIVRVPAGLEPSLPQSEKNGLNDATMAAHQSFQASNEEQEDVLQQGDKMCAMKVTMNLGETTPLTGREFPILSSLGLSIERGTLKPNAIVSPHYTIGAQSVVYVTRGSVTLQVVDNRGVAVFDGVLRQGQPLVVPEYYALLAEAGKDGAEYVVYKTDANPVVNRIAGRGSVLRALPVGVIVAAYNVSASDAVKIKNSGGN